VNALEKQVLRIIGEDPSAPDVFTDDPAGIAQIRDSINDAIQELAILAGGHEDTFHVPLLSDANFYRINFQRGYFGWVKECWLVGSKRRLVQTDFVRLEGENPQWLQTSGTPTEYMQIGLNVIGINRAPTSSSDMLELHCVVVPAPYDNDNDRVKLRDAFKFAAVNYAVSEYWASRGDAPSAVNHLSTYVENSGNRLAYDPSANRFTVFRQPQGTPAAEDQRQ